MYKFIRVREDVHEKLVKLRDEAGLDNLSDTIDMLIERGSIYPYRVEYNPLWFNVRICWETPGGKDCVVVGDMALCKLMKYFKLNIPKPWSVDLC